jgi:hypothetical protein
MASQANFYTTTSAGLTVWYSYQTPIAFVDPKTGRTVARVNDWSTTTGRHITQADGGSKEAKARRLSGDDFERALKEAMQIASAPAVAVAHPE